MFPTIAHAAQSTVALASEWFGEMVGTALLVFFINLAIGRNRSKIPQKVGSVCVGLLLFFAVGGELHGLQFAGIILGGLSAYLYLRKTSGQPLSKIAQLKRFRIGLLGVIGIFVLAAVVFTSFLTAVEQKDPAQEGIVAESRWITFTSTTARRSEDLRREI